MYKKNIVVADTVSFGYSEKKIIKDISLTISKQESVVFLGSSGSGKSTFLKLCCGLLKPVSGIITVNDVEMYALKDHDKRSFMISDIGFLFQDGALINNLNVFDNIALPLRYHKMYSEKEIVNKVWEVLEQFEITHVSDANPATLSLGQRKFVAFARVFLTEPSVLFLDEPTASVDMHSAEKMIQMIRLYNILGGTIISITHDMFYANSIASLMGIIHQGELVEFGRPSQIKFSDNPVIKMILKSVNKDADMADLLLRIMN